MESIIPYLTFNGTAKQAFEFYAKALNGKIVEMNHFGDSSMESKPEDKDKVMHAILKAGDLTLMTSDTHSGQEVSAGSMVSLSMNFNDDESISRTYEALSEGAEITMPLQDTFWGAKFGILKDKFGIQWMFNYDKPEKEA